jgi:hypothetical protein
VSARRKERAASDVLLELFAALLMAKLYEDANKRNKGGE